VDAGDEIVTYGAFSIDPEAQLGGKPSMMNPEGGPSSSGHDHGSMEMNTASSISKSSGVEMSSETISKKPDEVRQLVMRYSELKNALVSDDFETSKTKYEKVNLSLSHLDSQTFKTSSSINNIDELREVFIQLSEAVIAVAKVNNPTEDSLYVLRCPMANKSEGASWLSFSKEVKNPYYGASMLKCGSVIDSIQ
jgi:Cu(I)/Ag(I) efflux system membrane fusion protein